MTELRYCSPPERHNLGAKYLGFFSSRSLKTREKYTISFAQFVYFLNDKIHNYVFVDICNCEFYHSKIEK